MSLVVALTVFATIFPAELPDKTFVAVLVLSTRFAPLPVWVGAAAAFVVQSLVAVTAGGLVSLLPKQPVRAVTAVLFLAGAIVLLRLQDEPPEQEAREVEEEVRDVPRRPSFRRASLTTFGVLFAAEWGDLSQVLTAAFAAKYRDPVSVGVGATAALWLVAGLGVIGGRSLLKVIPVVWIRRVAAVLFFAFAVITAVDAARA
ncbi:MAG: Ca2+/H+ antiporter, family [Frankiaceae bacterium]|nr:Ca2+/H+ antiporter, family [Frankiaceae bacterium]